MREQCVPVFPPPPHKSLGTRLGIGMTWVMKNGEIKLGHLFHYSRGCKNTLTILFREHAYSTTGKFKSALFDIWLYHLANCILVGHGLYTQPHYITENLE